jgi:hypothetical protein
MPRVKPGGPACARRHSARSRYKGGLRPTSSIQLSERKDDMRMFIFLVAAVLALSFSFYSSAGGLKRASTTAPQGMSVDANPQPRCLKSKKMRQAATGVCVVKGKRRDA